jgi:hypothetical protein
MLRYLVHPSKNRAAYVHDKYINTALNQQMLWINGLEQKVMFNEDF